VPSDRVKFSFSAAKLDLENQPSTVSKRNGRQRAGANVSESDGGKGQETAPKKKGDLLPRVITSVIMVPILLAMIIVGPHWLWAAFIAAATAVGLSEFYGMLQKDEPKSVQWGSTAIGTAFAASLYLFVGPKPMLGNGSHDPLVIFAVLAVVLWASFLFNLGRDRDIGRVAVTMSSGLAGVLYVGLTFSFIALLKRDMGDWGAGWIIMLLAMTWMSDTGAYFAGRAFGKHKLAPKVSPKKTVEGALGGLLATIVAAFVVRALMLPFLSLIDVAVIALVANVLGQTGDLCESLLKRSTGVKDSGTIIHGHGGMLDRVDAVLFAVPWVYLYASMCGGAALL